MARYRKIEVRIWNDEKFLSLSDDGKLIFILLLTHPFMTSIGAMKFSYALLASDIRWDVERVEKAFREAFRKGMAKADFQAGLVVLPNFLKYNKPESPNVVKSWADVIDLLPECGLLSSHIIQVKGFVEGLGKAFMEALPEAFRKGMPNPEPEPEQEQEQEKESGDPPSPAASADSAAPPPGEAENSGGEQNALAEHPALDKFFTELLGLIRAAHPKAKIPADGSAEAGRWRGELARLVRLDGYTEGDVIGALEWVFKGEDRDARFWCGNVASAMALRKRREGDALRKFDKIAEAWRKSVHGPAFGKATAGKLGGQGGAPADGRNVKPTTEHTEIPRIESRMDAAGAALWERALSELRDMVDPESFGTWFSEVKPLVLEPEADAAAPVCVLSVPSVFYRNWIANNYEELIGDVLAGLVDREVAIKYQVEADFE